MNKRGQTLILFIILIPIILGLGAFVVDTGLIITKTVHLKEVSKTIIEDVFEEASKNKITEMFLENDIHVDNLKIDIGDNYINVTNEYNIESIFGKIIGLNNYKIKVNILGKKVSNKIIFE